MGSVPAIRVLGSKSNSFELKSVQEVELEALLVEDLENQLLNSKSLVGESQAHFTQSQDVYFDKDGIANVTFNELFLVEHNADMVANDTMEGLDSLINSYQAIDIF